MSRNTIILTATIFLITLLIPSLATATYLIENSTWQVALTGAEFNSVAWGDINNDSKLDLVLIGCTYYSPTGCTTYLTKVYINNGTSLVDNATWNQNLTIVNYGSVAWGDVDNDGDLDLALIGCNNGGGTSQACNSGEQAFIYINNGSSLIENSTWKGDITNVWKGSLAWGDVNNDGLLDLALTGQGTSSKISKIYINNGSSLVENSTWQASLSELYESAVAWADVNNDGDLDLILSGDAAISDERTEVYINNGTSLVENSTWEQSLLVVDWSAVAVGDVDNDGDLDFTLIGHDTGDRHRIYNNTGNTFVETQKESGAGGNLRVGVFEGSLAWGDYDNDGDLDLAVTGNEGYTYVYENKNGNFSDTGENLLPLEKGSYVAWADVDNDGDLDLALFGYYQIESENKAKIYLNNINISNTAPSPPSSLNSTYSNNQFTLTWGNGSDTETPTPGLYYNLRVGTASGGNDIVSGVFGGGDDNGYFGNMMQRKSISLKIAEQNYFWSVQTIDTGLAKGNWSAEQTYNTSADNDEPAVSANSPVNGLNTSAEVLFNVTVYDIGVLANVTLYLNGTYNETNTSGVNNTYYTFKKNLTEGSHSWYVIACDNANNCNTSQQRTITMDITGPTITIHSPENNSITNNSAVPVNFSLTDAVGANTSRTIVKINLTYYTESNISCNNTCNFTAQLNDFTYTLTINATDNLGNNATLSINFTVDTTIATNASLLTVNDSDGDGNIELTWTDDSSENNETYKIYRSSSKITNATGMTPIAANISEGTQSFEDNTTVHGSTYWYALVTVDAAGNYNKSIVSVSFNGTANDTIKPQSVQYFNLTGSGATATLWWTNITQDTAGNPETHSNNYSVWYGTSINTSKMVNETLTFLKNVSANSTTWSLSTEGTFTYHFVVSTVDDGDNENLSIISGNYGNVSLTYTAPTTPSSGGGGGGGGSGGAVSTAGVSASHKWSSMPEGTTTMEVRKTAISFKKLEISVRSEVVDVEVTVTKLDEKPAGIVDAGVKIYQYIEVNTENLVDDDVADVVIEFKVNKTWLVENNVDEGDIVLNRYTAKWDELPTKKLSSDDLYVYYEATSPGLSYFAVSVKEKVVEVVVEENVTEEVTPTIEWPEVVEEVRPAEEETKKRGKAYIIWIAAVIIALVVITGVLIYEKKRKKEEIYRILYSRGR